MEPITVTAKLDLKTYYRIFLSVMYRTRHRLSMLIVFIGINVFMFIDKPFDWVTELICTGIMALLYGVVIPIRIWYICKKNMRTSPTLIHGITYHITNESIEGIAPDSSAKTNWSLIGKVVEKDNYFLMFNVNSPIMFRYLPKDGFVSAEDIERFKEIVRGNKVKANFK